MAPGVITDYTRYLSPVALQRKPSAIRRLQPLLLIPGMVSMGGGMPNPSQFPFSSLSVGVGPDSSISLSATQLQSALQYSSTRGLPSLLTHLQGMVSPNSSVMVTGGSQEALSRAFEMLLEPGATVLVESPTYSGALSFLQPYGACIKGIPCDDQGMEVHALAEAAPSAKIVYLIPNCQNPSGVSMSLDRKRQVYELACKHDLLILEDDPYYYLGQGTATLQSLDTEGRVLRFDSFSKVLSSGLRLGFASGPEPLIRGLELHAQCTSLHTSGVSQALVSALLDSWGIQGFRTHCEAVAKFYRDRRDVFLAMLDKHVPQGLIQYSIPEGGMFLWIRVLGVTDTQDLVTRAAEDHKVLFVPGQCFDPHGQACPYLRASYSTASDQDMEHAARGLANLLTTT